MKQKTLSKKQMYVLSFLVVATLLGLGFIGVMAPQSYNYKLSSFESYDQLFDFLLDQSTQQNSYENFNDLTRIESAVDTMNAQGSSGQTGGSDDISYSETNIQVEGIDEPDIVKTDGTYLYILVDSTIFIVRSYPTSSLNVESKITLNDSYYYSSLFISQDTLIVFGQSYPSYWLYREPLLLEKEVDETIDEDEKKTPDTIKPDTTVPLPGEWNVAQTTVQVFDLSDRRNPTVIKKIEIDGSFVNARMMNSFMYLVASESIYDVYRIMEEVDYFRIPQITVNGNSENISASQMYYVDEPEDATTFTHVLTLNLNDYSFTEKSFLIGNTQEIYMSKQHLYLVYSSYEYNPGLLGKSSFNQNNQITKIHKIEVDNDSIRYLASGKVQGRLLNQFSMDEHQNHFRIATTTGYSWNDDNPSMNHVYILDNELTVVSSITNIAPGEQIYSARFMGDTAFLVTFKNTDPFFTLDLSDPENPMLLGELKLPGFSDYLHPYDEHHIIGIGKDTVASNNPNFAWYQGVKLALFNVSDLSNPVLVDTEIIGDRGSYTPVLSDHHALLFNKQKNLLVLPVSVYEINDEEKTTYENDPGTYGHFSYQGAYVFSITSQGFSLKDRITHLNQTSINKLQHREWYYGDEQSFIQRCLYIENVLYTISEAMVQTHSLDTVSFIDNVSLLS